MIICELQILNTPSPAKDKSVIHDQILIMSDDESRRIIAAWSSPLLGGQISAGELYKSVASVAARHTQPRLISWSLI